MKFLSGETWTPYVLGVLFLLFLPPSNLAAQTFANSYPNAHTADGGTCLLPLGSDTLLVGGYKGDSTLLLWTDPLGNVLRKRTFRFSNGFQLPGDRLYTVIRSSQGTLIGTGGSFSTGSPVVGYVFCYDPISDQLCWTRRLPTGYLGFDLVEDSPGQITLVGYNNSGVLGNDGITLRLDLGTGTITGNTARNYNLGSAELFKAVQQRGSDLLVTGRFNHAGGGFTTMRASVAQLNSNLTVTAARSYFVPTNQSARMYSEDLVLIPGNSSAFCGGGSPINGSFLSSLGFIGTQNSQLGAGWNRTYDFTNLTGEFFTELAFHNNSYYAMGRLFDQDERLILLKTNDGGTPEWAYSYADYMNIFHDGEDQMLIWNNSIYITGSTPQGSGNTDVSLLRLSLDGTLDGNCPVDSHSVQVQNYFADFPAALTTNPTTISTHTPNLSLKDPVLADSSWCAPICQLQNHPSFTTLNPGGPLSGYQVWDGKLYVPDNVQIVLDGAGTVLDVTTADIVFGACAGITVQNGAVLRANNSVFRSCSPTEPWQGIRLVGNGPSEVNACTFKNAQNALEFLGVAGTVSNSTCSVTDNLFSNNRRGIFASNVVLDWGITGNSFVVDGKAVSFQSGSCAPSPTYNFDHYGIQANGVDFAGTISQNRFINSGGFTTGVNLIGIQALQSGGTASLNQFTNNLRGVELSDCDFFSIENNAFEVTQDNAALENQIRVSGFSDWIWIVGNRLANSNEPSAFSTQAAGILAENSSIVNIKENEVDGFIVGIAGIGLTQSQIAENLLSNQVFYGVFVQEGVNIDVNCNTIQPRTQPNGITVGIGYLNFASGSSIVRVRSNCVFDARYSILTFSSTSTPLPLLTNNYLFNYGGAGLYNLGCTGSIGTNPSPITAAGRNSFASNNSGNLNSFDIFSTQPITAVGNSGIQFVNPNVFTNGNGLYSSTTACGNQPATLNAQFLDADRCDTFTDDMDGIFRLAQQQGPRALGLEAVENEMQRYALAKAWATKALLAGQLDLAGAIRDEFAALSGSVGLEARLAAHLVLLQSGDLGLAAAEMQGAATDDWGRLGEVEWRLRSGQVLSAQDRSVLRALDLGDGAMGALSGDWLSQYAERNGYPYAELFRPEAPAGMERQAVGSYRLGLSPNPGRDRVKAVYALPAEGTLSVYDVHGKALLSYELDHESGYRIFDWSALAPGIYLVTVDCNGERIASTKWIKI